MVTGGGNKATWLRAYWVYIYLNDSDTGLLHSQWRRISAMWEDFKGLVVWYWNKERRMIRAAPVAFTIAVLAAGILLLFPISIAFSMYYSHEISQLNHDKESLNTDLGTQKDINDALREKNSELNTKLSGASTPPAASPPAVVEKFLNPPSRKDNDTNNRAGKPTFDSEGDVFEGNGVAIAGCGVKTHRDRFSDNQVGILCPNRP